MLYIGRSGHNPDFLNGLIDDVRIYPFALTAEQVKQEYAGGRSLVLGSGSTGVGGTSPSNAASREYCVPGDTSFCAPPVGEWKFEEYSGTTAYDTSSNGNHGTLVGGPKFVLGAQGVGTGVRFDGGDDYVSVGNNPSLRLTSGGTISAWILPKSGGEAGYGRIINKSTDVNGSSVDWSLNIEDNSGQRRLRLNIGRNSDAAALSTVGSIEYGKWHHVVGIISTDQKIYVNGQDVTDTINGNSLPGDHSAHVTIGNASGDGLYNWPQKLDHVLRCRTNFS